MKVLFTVGYQNKPFNKTLYEKNGMGGSEYCVINLADKFAEDGHDVYVTGEVEIETYNKVKYINYGNLANNQHFDIVIASNYIHYFKHLEEKNITFNKSYFWIHNLEFYPFYNGEVLPNNGLDYLNHPKLTNIIAVSDWQKDKLVKKYNLNPNKVKVIGNAINPQDFDNIKQEQFNDKVIYTSGPDRGLWNLLQIWDDLKKINPKLTLWVANPPYTDGWPEWDKIKKDFPDYDKRFDVHYLGSLNPSDLIRQIKSSEWWIYPSQYPETYCITALEMMMGRVKVLSSDTGNLKDLLKDKSTLVSSFTHDNIQNQDSPFLEDNEENAKNVGLMRYTFVAAYAFSNEQGKKLNENLNKSGYEFSN